MINYTCMSGPDCTTAGQVCCGVSMPSAGTACMATCPTIAGFGVLQLCLSPSECSGGQVCALNATLDAYAMKQLKTCQTSDAGAHEGGTAEGGTPEGGTSEAGPEAAATDAPSGG